MRFLQNDQWLTHLTLDGLMGYLSRMQYLREKLITAEHYLEYSQTTKVRGGRRDSFRATNG